MRVPRLLAAASLAALLAAPGVLAAQDVVLPTGRIVGRVIDASSGQGIPDVAIKIVGTSTGATSGVDGRYTIGGARTGTTTLEIRRLGFQPKSLTGLFVDAGKTIEQDITMTPAVTTLEAVQTVEAEKGSVEATMNAQRKASGVVSSVTAEQIAKSPDGDVAQVTKRAAGVTMTDGVPDVRGLGAQYNGATLNDSKIPSPDPERHAVPLDMVSAGFVQSVDVKKTFTPDMQGDFAGAIVNIKTKEFPAHPMLTLQLGSGYSSGATGASLLRATSAGGEAVGMVGHHRDLPELVRAQGNFQHSTLQQNDINLLVGSFRNAWSPRQGTGAPRANGSVSMGGNRPIFGQRIGYLLSGTMATGMDVKDHQTRALADRGSVKGSTVEMDRFDGQTVSQSVLWGGLTNLSTMIGDHSHLTFNGLYNRSADNDARVEDGTFTADAIKVRLTRMQYVERGVYSGQLGGEHQLSERQRLDWSATASGVRRFEPDRSEFAQVYEHDSPSSPEVLRWLTGGSGGAVRTFADLHEHSHEYRGSYKLSVGRDERQTTITVGALQRNTVRDAQSLSYVISAKPGATNAMRELPPEQIFDGRYTAGTADIFTIGPLSQGGSYNTRDELSAAFAMADVPVTTRIRMIAGARLERDHLDVEAISTLGSPVTTRKRWNDPLPSLSLNMALSETQQLRVSATRTLVRPEYRQLSPIISRDVIGGENVQGDEHLDRTNITNLDVRWERYPSAGELISVAVFAKTFTAPIERVYGSGSGGTSYVFFTNARSADDIGIELEVHKNLGLLAAPLAQMSVFGNATVMRSRIHLRENTMAAATNLSRAMVGQAPYVLNAGLTYASPSGKSTTTLLFNRVGERITAAGSSPLPDVIERPRNVVDLSYRIDLRRSVAARFDAKNVLDSPYRLMQGSVTRESYRNGATLQAGLQWRP